MDNEDKIKKNDLEAPDSKAIFLKDDAIRYAGIESYNIEKEFAKTKKNKSPFIWITIMLFVAVFSAAAVLVTVYIQNRSKNVPVNIEDFADVNLKDVLDKAKQYDTQLTKAQRELEDLQNEMNTEIDTVQQKSQRDIELIQANNIGQAEKNRQIAAVQARTEENINNIRAEYDEPIRQKQEEIAGIQEKINQYDTQMVQQARAQEEVLNNQQKKFEIELDQTVTYYENKIDELESQQAETVKSLKDYQDTYAKQLRQNQEEEIARLKQEQAAEIRRLILKYNPIFTSDELKAILAIAVDDIPDINLGTYREVLANEGIISQENFNTIHANINRINTILEGIQKIPYINSMPEAIKRLSYFGTLTYNNYEQLIANMINTIEYKNNVIYSQYVQLGYYQYALSSLIEESREHGYILDPRNPNNIQIFIDEMHDVADGDTAYVFRSDQELIAKIRISVNNGYISASLLEQVSEDKIIEPFDKILIQTE